MTRSMLAMLCALCAFTGATATAQSPAGPLRVHPDNPRYFTHDGRRAILLTGSHTWNNLVDMGPSDPPAAFDFAAHLDWLQRYHHNFFRLWTWQLLTWDTRGNREEDAQLNHVRPHAWKRTGPGQALDGKPKFDLRQYDADYFARLHDRVRATQARSMYPAVMLFEGWGTQFSPDAWRQHPFHKDNNVNGVDGDLDGDGKGLEVYTGRSEAITELQRAYVRQVVDTVNEFDNVLYEISNETQGDSTEWQYAMIRYVKEYERTKPRQHPVGMTFQYQGGNNQTLFDSPADWISPNPEGGYRDDPPAADGAKVIVADTDHLWGIGGNPGWVWRSFLRGLNPIYMDPYDGAVLRLGFDPVQAESVRKSMGYVLDWSQRVDLAAMTPQDALASSRYCLARLGVEYLVYVPTGAESLTVELPAGGYSMSWFNTTTGEGEKPSSFEHAGGKRDFDFSYPEALLHIQRAD